MSDTEEHYAERIDELEAENARLTERLARIRAILSEGLPVGSPESRLASDLREVLGDE